MCLFLETNSKAVTTDNYSTMIMILETEVTLTEKF